jgi:hypothetical protein
MFKQTRLTLLSLAVLLALLMAATMPLSAFAQDEVPPVPVAEEIFPVEEESAPDGEPAPAAEEAPTMPEILEALPEGTDLVVLDESGEALPLAAEEAAEVVAAADPFFWDGAQYVGYSESGVCAAQVTVCNTSATPLQAAINAFRDSSTATGSIYVAAGNYAANVTINGSAGNLKNLTGLIGECSATTTLNGNVKLQDLNIDTNVFTFQGFTLANGSFWAYNNTTTLNITDISQSGSKIGFITGSDVGFIIEEQDGNVNLTDVSAKENTDGDIYLNIDGNTTIKNSEVVNSNYGIVIKGGTATLNNVNIHNNNYGVYVVSDGKAVIGCSTLTGNHAYNTYGLVTFNDALACGAKGQDKVPFPKVPPVEPPNSETVLTDDNEIKNVFALLSDQIIVVTAPSTAGELPANLPTGKTFVAGASLTLTQNGEEIESAPNRVQAFIEIPDGMEPPFTVLMWNGSAWVEVPSQVVDGKVVFSVTNPGIYVLAGQ